MLGLKVAKVGHFRLSESRGTDKKAPTKAGAISLRIKVR